MGRPRWPRVLSERHGLLLLAHQPTQGGNQVSDLRVADRVSEGQRALLARGRGGDRAGEPVGATLRLGGLRPLEELCPLNEAASRPDPVRRPGFAPVTSCEYNYLIRLGKSEDSPEY